jgi:SagB-type dehydrogenase family enzyme
MDSKRTCRCGSSSGQYRADGWDADVWGPQAVMLGLRNEYLPELVLGQGAGPGGEYATVGLYAIPPGDPRAFYHDDATDQRPPSSSGTEAMRTFGYQAHRTAVCEGCGTRLPTDVDPAIVWAHSLDGLAYAAYCGACASRLGVNVVERIVPEPDPSGRTPGPDRADDDRGCLQPVQVLGSKDEVSLPEPRLRGPLSVEEALARRRSVREYAETPLSFDQLSQLLWAAQGTTERTHGLRTVPSAGALYPLEVYVAAERIDGLRSGVYRYVPGRHSLRLVLEGSVCEQLCRQALSQEALREAPAALALSAVFARTTGKYGERGRRYVYMEVAHAAQNVSLQAIALGLGTVVIGAFDDESVKSTLGMREDEEPLYLVPVGWPRSE